MTGTVTCLTISGTARAAASVFTVTRTSSLPAAWSALTWATVPATSAVSVLVMDCTTMGRRPPTFTPPTSTATVFRRSGVLIGAMPIIPPHPGEYHDGHVHLRRGRRDARGGLVRGGDGGARGHRPRFPGPDRAGPGRRGRLSQDAAHVYAAALRPGARARGGGGLGGHQGPGRPGRARRRGLGSHRGRGGADLPGRHEAGRAGAGVRPDRGRGGAGGPGGGPRGRPARVRLLVSGAARAPRPGGRAGLDQGLAARGAGGPRRGGDADRGARARRARPDPARGGGQRHGGGAGPPELPGARPRGGGEPGRHRSDPRHRDQPGRGPGPGGHPQPRVGELRRGGRRRNSVRCRPRSGPRRAAARGAALREDGVRPLPGRDPAPRARGPGPGPRRLPLVGRARARHPVRARQRAPLADRRRSHRRARRRGRAAAIARRREHARRAPRGPRPRRRGRAPLGPPGRRRAARHAALPRPAARRSAYHRSGREPLGRLPGLRGPRARHPGRAGRSGPRRTRRDRVREGFDERGGGRDRGRGRRAKERGRQLGMIGLGRMGANMVRRVRKAGHECVAYDVHADAVSALAREGVVGATVLPAFVKALARPRTVWLMVPAGGVDQTLRELVPLLEADDVVIDGGNSHYHDDIRRAGELRARGLHYVDVGTSGGVWGLERGFCLMIGGEAAVVKRLDPIFAALAPGIGVVPSTAGREQIGGTAEQGYLHCGPSGAGHFVKMVHNGIEYGIMAAYAEGMAVLRGANVGTATHAIDAETTPLRDPEHYRYDLDLRDIAEVWRRGSVIASWLLDLTAAALLKDAALSQLGGRDSDSGEGRWTIAAAIDEGVPAPVLSTALYERFGSRGNGEFAARVLSALRFEFGGHHEKPAEEGCKGA